MGTPNAKFVNYLVNTTFSIISNTDLWLLCSPFGCLLISQLLWYRLVVSNMTNSVSHPPTYSNTGMNLIGYLVATPLVILLLPLLPVLILLLIGDKITMG